MRHGQLLGELGRPAGERRPGPQLEVVMPISQGVEEPRRPGAAGGAPVGEFFGEFFGFPTNGAEDLPPLRAGGAFFLPLLAE